jgi:hypothetical protein
MVPMGDDRPGGESSKPARSLKRQTPALRPGFVFDPTAPVGRRRLDHKDLI